MLPGFLRKSDAGNGLQRPGRQSGAGDGPTLLAESAVRKSDLFVYQVPVERDADALMRPGQRTDSTCGRNSAGVTWQPLGMLTLSSDLASTRDLRRYDDSTVVGPVGRRIARRALAGMDVGVERDRQFSTCLALSPRLASWFRPRYITSSGFALSRSLTSRDPIREDGDTAGAFLLPQTLNNSRFNGAGSHGRSASDSSPDCSEIRAASAAATRRIRPFDFSDRSTRNSTFDLAAFNPDLGYMLGLGGLDDFLRQQGDSAVGVAETRNTTLSSGAELPLGVSFSLGYGRIRTNRFQRASGTFLTTETNQREWPKGSIRVTRSLRNFPIAVIGVGTNFRATRGSTVLPSFAGGAARAPPHGHPPGPPTRPPP